MAGKEDFPVYPGWETVRKLGNGSFGAVYEIQRNLFGTVEKAALKQISIPQDQGDVEELYSTGYDDASITAHYESYLADIVKEYQLMAEMKGHTNVVYCDDIRYIQKDSGIGWDIYIKMELLTPMMKMLDKLSDEKQILKLGKDLSGALVLCRSRNIIHRDIKPQNIFISKDGDFKLGDFGIAKTAEKTSGGTKIGTYNYMAPEVYNNQPYGHGADIYSLGLVLYWLLNNRRLPFYPAPPAIPKASDMESARLRRFRGDVIPAPAHGSEELKRIVLKACAYDPKDRYQTAEEMLQDLDALSGGKGAYAPVFSPALSEYETPDAAGTVGAFSRTASALSSAAGSGTANPSVVPVMPDTDSTVGVFHAASVSVNAPRTAEPDADGTVGVLKTPAAATKGDKVARDADGTVAVFQGRERAQKTNKTVPTADASAQPGKPTPEKQPLLTEKAAPDKKKKTGLIAGILGALVLAAILLIVLLPKNGNKTSSSSYRPSSTAKATASSTPVPTSEPSEESTPEPSEEPTASIEDAWDWSLEDGVLTITGTGNMLFPNSYDVPWKDQRNDIISVVIGEGITDIGYHAFYSCKNLTSVMIPEGVSTVEDGAFEYCDGLTCVELPSSLVNIGESAFNSCRYLTSAVLPDGLKSIGEGAFRSCESLTGIEIPAGVSSIGEGAFSACKSLSEIKVDAGNEYYKSVDGVLFSKDGNLLLCFPAGSAKTDYVIPSGVERIGLYAFWNCKNLVNLQFESDVKSIGVSAFGFCDSLKRIEIPDSVTRIELLTFSNCEKLESIEIPDSIVYIGDSAFSNTGISCIEIPSSVTEIGEFLFSSCYNLTEIVVAEGNQNYLSVDGVLFSKDFKTIIRYPQGKTDESYSIPAGVETIAEGAFSGCGRLKSLEIPEGVSLIKRAAFSDCFQLPSLRIPLSVTCIEATVFSGCYNLTDIYYPGTEEQWNAISVDPINNKKLLEATIHFNAD